MFREQEVVAIYVTKGMAAESIDLVLQENRLADPLDNFAEILSREIELETGLDWDVIAVWQFMDPEQAKASTDALENGGVLAFLELFPRDIRFYP